MKIFILILIVFVSLLLKVTSGEEVEDKPWLEYVDYKGGECVKGEKVRFHCKTCICEENSRVICPKWVKCCEAGTVWQTNSCNICHCTEDYKRICEATKCVFSN